jgi:hypothetical protein
MNSRSLLESLVYLDRDFIAAAFEALKGHAPLTQITKNEGMNAGAKVPFFTAGLSATETKSFSVSTFGMLIDLLPELQNYPKHTTTPVGATEPSRIGWIHGQLSIFKVVVRESGKEHNQIKTPRTSKISHHRLEKSSETYFAIHTPDSCLKIALITTPDYFSSGVGSLINLYETVLDKVSIPVKALVRVYDATSSFQEWVGVPLVVYEHREDA